MWSFSWEEGPGWGVLFLLTFLDPSSTEPPSGRLGKSQTGEAESPAYALQ